MRSWLAVGPVVMMTVFGSNSATAQRGIEHRQIEVGEFVFDALAAGPADGELVILLHGFPQTSYSFRRQLPVLARAGYRAVAPDQRGYSPGARPANVSDYALQSTVADVIGMVDALDRGRFHLVGHDWGGAVAWVTATQVPDRIMSLTVLSTPHYLAFGAALADTASEQSSRSSYMAVFGAEGAEERFLADDAAFLRQIYQGGGLSQEEIQVYVDALGTPDAMRAALNWYSALSLPSPAAGPSSSGGTSGFRPIEVPTLYVWSTEDGAFARETAERTRDYVTGPYRFEVLDGISHWVPEQAADRVNELLLEHLRARSR